MPTLIQAIMSIYEARENCKQSGNSEWHTRHSVTLRKLYEMLPSGSGIDNGTLVEAISTERLKLICGFHHMDDDGHYVGRTHHMIRVTPSWHGVNITIGGPDRNGIKQHLYEVYYTCLTSEVLQSSDGLYHFAEVL